VRRLLWEVLGWWVLRVSQVLREKSRGGLSGLDSLQEEDLLCEEELSERVLADESESGVRPSAEPSARKSQVVHPELAVSQELTWEPSQKELRAVHPLL